MTKLPAQPNRSLLEGIEVLLAVARRGEPVRVRPLARELGMTPTRLQRYLGTLAHGGLLRQLPDRSYGAGPGMHALSAISLTASGLAVRAMEVLPKLSELNCIVVLGILWRASVSYLYFQMPESSVAKSLGKESDYPAEDSSIGRLLLSELETGHVRTLLPECGNSLIEELNRTRERGYALVHQLDGTTSLAVKVGEPAIAGLALSGHISMARIPALVERLRTAANELI